MSDSKPKTEEVIPGIPAWASYLWGKAPLLLVAFALIWSLMNGWLVTGRTFDREITRCTQEAKDWKETAIKEMQK